MEQILNYVKPELIVVAAVLYFVGMGIKKAEAIADKYPCKTTLIGDCQQPSKAGKAIREGFYAAMSLQ